MAVSDDMAALLPAVYGLLFLLAITVGAFCADRDIDLSRVLAAGALVAVAVVTLLAPKRRGLPAAEPSPRLVLAPAAPAAPAKPSAHRLAGWLPLAAEADLVVHQTPQGPEVRLVRARPDTRQSEVVFISNGGDAADLGHHLASASAGAVVAALFQQPAVDSPGGPLIEALGPEGEEEARPLAGATA